MPFPQPVPLIHSLRGRDFFADGSVSFCILVIVLRILLSRLMLAVTCLVHGFVFAILSSYDSSSIGHGINHCCLCRSRRNFGFSASRFLGPCFSFLISNMAFCNSRRNTSKEEEARSLQSPQLLCEPRFLTATLGKQSSSCLGWVRHSISLCSRGAITVCTHSLSMIPMVHSRQHIFEISSYWSPNLLSITSQEPGGKGKHEQCQSNNSAPS